MVGFLSTGLQGELLSAPGITLASSEFRSGLWDSAYLKIYPSFCSLLHKRIDSGGLWTMDGFNNICIRCILLDSAES